VWQVNVFMAEWLRLQDDIARLRVLVEPGLPARVCPVEGFTWFRDEWASARPWARIHKGVDMNTEFGQVLVAVEDGVVIQANWHRLGGRQVWFRGDSTGDVYYYAHLEYWPRWLWSGSRLEAGDYLGLAGTSGNADSPHLHFGWMPGSNDVDLDNLQNPYYLVYELCH
jgi:murein DD-endopeptidase MepM/ murein hydrolase activator NlpD